MQASQNANGLWHMLERLQSDLRGEDEVRADAEEENRDGDELRRKWQQQRSWSRHP